MQLEFGYPLEPPVNESLAKVLKTSLAQKIPGLGGPMEITIPNVAPGNYHVYYYEIPSGQAGLLASGVTVSFNGIMQLWINV